MNIIEKNRDNECPPHIHRLLSQVSNTKIILLFMIFHTASFEERKVMIQVFRETRCVMLFNSSVNRIYMHTSKQYHVSYFVYSMKVHHK